MDCAYKIVRSKCVIFVPRACIMFLAIMMRHTNMLPRTEGN